jgi:hypothetical protein
MNFTGPSTSARGYSAMTLRPVDWGFWGTRGHRVGLDPFALLCSGRRLPRPVLPLQASFPTALGHGFPRILGLRLDA